MIESVTGIAIASKESELVLQLGPINLRFFVPDTHGVSIGSSLTVFGYLHWHQEQGPSLYGFLTELDRHVFMLVIGCSGIGPRIGLAILKDLGAHAFVTAVHNADGKMISKVNGIGIKKAEQIIVLLKDKVSNVVVDEVDTHGRVHWHTVRDALTSLNYSSTEITRALQHLQKQGMQNVAFETLFRNALSFLSQQ